MSGLIGGLQKLISSKDQALARNEQTIAKKEQTIANKEQTIFNNEQIIARHEQRIAQIELELKLREEQLRLARIRQYGAKGEGLSHEQVMLLNLEPGVSAAEVEKEAALPESEKQQQLAAAAAAAATQSKSKAGKRYIKAHPGRQALPAHLPRREVIIPCEEGAAGVLIGYEVKEELVIQPAEFYVNVIKREKRRIVIGERSTILTGAMPPRIVEKGQLDNSVIIDLLVSKYCDHQPIYRQMQRWQRDHGLSIDAGVPLRGIMSAGRLLQALARRIGEELKAGGLIQADETRVPVLQNEGKGRNDTAWFWQYSRPGGPVYFDYQNSRSRAGPSAYLQSYTGRLQSDGYEVYSKLGEQMHSHAGCWAHVRRKFVEAQKIAPQEAPCRDSQRMLAHIGGLYAIETEARERRLSGVERLKLRQERGLETKLEAIARELIELRQRGMPASQLGKASAYALGQWGKLIVYASDGDIEIDNNWCENAMRPIALGRKNWLHLGSQESGPVVAAIMSVIASARRAELNVRDYLSDTLARLTNPEFKTSQLSELLPTAWSAAQAPATR